jgi:hypothetical protein
VTSTVRRVHEEAGSHIEPPLDDGWSDLDKLRWHLAVALHDARLPEHLASVEPGHVTRNGVPIAGLYNIRYRSVAGRTNGSWGAGDFRSTWSLINGIGLGFAIAHGEAR